METWTEMRAETRMVMRDVFLKIARIFVYNYLLNFARCSNGVQKSIDRIQTRTRATVRGIVQTNFFFVGFF